MGSDPIVTPARVSALLAAGADPNARNSQGRTPLFYATAAALGLLLGAGGDARARDSGGQTALHLQALSSPESIALLLAAGAEVNARDASGETPMHKVAGMKEPWERLWRPLLAAGAEINVANEAGELAAVAMGAAANEAGATVLSSAVICCA